MPFFFPVAVASPSGVPPTLEDSALSLDQDHTVFEILLGSIDGGEYNWWNGSTKATCTVIWWYKNQVPNSIGAYWRLNTDGTGGVNDIGNITVESVSAANGDGLDIIMMEGDGSANEQKRYRYNGLNANTDWQCVAMTYDHDADSRQNPGNQGRPELFSAGVRLDPDSVIADDDVTGRNTGHAIRIGNGNYVGNGYTMAFWPKVLTDAEILAVYNAGVPVDPRVNFTNYESAADLTCYYVHGEASVKDELGTNWAPATFGSLDGGVEINLDLTDLVADTPANPA